MPILGPSLQQFTKSRRPRGNVLSAVIENRIAKALPGQPSTQSQALIEYENFMSLIDQISGSG
jgi:hypothetical protein